MEGAGQQAGAPARRAGPGTFAMAKDDPRCQLWVGNWPADLDEEAGKQWILQDFARSFARSSPLALPRARPLARPVASPPRLPAR